MTDRDFFQISSDRFGVLGELLAAGYVSALADYLTIKPTDPRIQAVSLAPRRHEAIFLFGEGRYTVRVISLEENEHRRLTEIWKGERCPNKCRGSDIRHNGASEFSELRYHCRGCDLNWVASEYLALARDMGEKIPKG